jgi:D-3-phosphoglycerate dehydrogenase
MISALCTVNLAENDQELLRRAGCNLIRYPWNGSERFLTAEEIETQIAGYDVLIITADQVSRQVMEIGTQLKIIAHYGSGLDNIDIEAASELGIVVISTPGANKIAVAEMVIGLMFSLARSLVQHHIQTKAGGWERRIGIELCGKTLGIIGLGQIGKEVARRSRCLGMQVVAYDIIWDNEFARANNVQRLSFQEVLRCADILSLHVPPTSNTTSLIGAEQMGMMKSGAMLINTARGAILDHDALYMALTSGHLASAALDVFAIEPPVGDPLLELDNVVVTPHVGGRTAESRARMSHMVIDGILALLQGHRPQNMVNPDVFTRDVRLEGTRKNLVEGT